MFNFQSPFCLVGLLGILSLFVCFALLVWIRTEAKLKLFAFSLFFWT